MHHGLEDTQEFKTSSPRQRFLKPRKEDLIAACNALGVSEAGSRSDLINRLEELLLYKFIKLQKTGGGVLHMGCTHSVVYYESPLWWQESARDHGDALLSFRHPPTVYISDIAGRVARHVNNRTNQRFFQPNDGRLCAATDSNIQDAANKKLEIHLPWVTSIGFMSTTTIAKDSPGDRLSSAHPETGSTNRFSLYDRFHQKNQKKPEELLRSVKVVPDLAALVNSSSAEQINRELSSSKYSLCQMKDIHFMFSLRLYFHLHNTKINKKYIKDLQRQTKEVLELCPSGKLTFGRPERRKISFPTSESQRETETLRSPDSTFSVAMFPTEPENLVITVFQLA
ncbi:HMG domain-containing protein 3-like [Paramormyrops kingsleyae]|uniref:HMG domain-containing protein 3-like n=1 Tax=Paramormyrops kingsleyae TaxID=1676925 RepID=UPI003B96E337